MVVSSLLSLPLHTDEQQTEAAEGTFLQSLIIKSSYS